MTQMDIETLLELECLTHPSDSQEKLGQEELIIHDCSYQKLQWQNGIAISWKVYAEYQPETFLMRVRWAQ